jgi:hypothetical protein
MLVCGEVPCGVVCVVRLEQRKISITLHTTAQ